MKKYVSLLLVIAMFGTLLVPGIGLFDSVPVQAESAAPVPDAFQMNIGEDGTVSNGVAGSLYALTSNGQPETKTDGDTGEKYVSFTTTSNSFYEVNMQSDSQGFFWDYYWSRNGQTKDLSFTWDFTVMLPEMPTGETDVFGYYEDIRGGGFGFLANATQGTIVLGNGYVSGNIYASGSPIQFSFDMQAGEWYHCVLTYDHTAKTAMAFVNGKNVYIEDSSVVSVPEVVEVFNSWNKNNVMSIGTKPVSGGAKNTAVGINNNVARYNLSSYAVTQEQAHALYLEAMEPWTKAPVPNAFQMNIANDGTVSNGIVSDIYRLSGSESKPKVYCDGTTGNPYVSFNSADNAYYEVSMRHTTAQSGFFWDYFWGRDTGRSFTWEFTFMVPEMPTEEVKLFGYYAANTSEIGGFGLSLDASQGIFKLGNGANGKYYSTAPVSLYFDMQANIWYHCVLTYDHSTKTAQAFVNGQSATTKDGAQVVAVNDFVASHYLWDKYQFCIGTAPERLNEYYVNHSVSSSIGIANNISLFNFSTYSVNELEANALYTQQQKQWTEYAEIKSAAPELTESITLHCTAMVSTKSYSDVKMVFNFKGENIEVVGSNEGACYTFALPGILPQDLGETISMALYAGDVLLDSYENYSIKSYCMNMLNRTTDVDVELRALLVALLNYGSQAQTYFGSELTSLANSELTETQKNYLPVYNIGDASSVESLLTGTANPDYVWKAATLSLQDWLQIRLRFTATDIQNVRILLGGEIFTYEDFIEAGNNTWFVYSSGIAAYAYNETITAMFVDALGNQIANTQMVHYSINTYVKYVNGLGTVAETELVKSIYSYGITAKAYRDVL
ncbi:MAG: hypothetical protein J6L76_01780 [Clostridia bacterium]|nr:hypothetical protein [Clostridia bacterium]